MVISKLLTKNTKPFRFRIFFAITNFLLIFCSTVGLSEELKGQGTILWKVSNSQTNKQSYFLGTLHQMGNSFVDSIPEIFGKLQESEIAIFETFDHSKRIRAVMNSRADNYDYKEILKRNEIVFIENLFDSLGVPVSKLTPIEALIKMDQIYVETICGTVKSSDSWDHFDN